MWVEPYEIMRYAFEQVQRVYPKADITLIPYSGNTKHIVQPRQLLWALLYGSACMTYPRIAAMTGGWNHTTILHGVRYAEIRLGPELLKILVQELGAWIDYTEAWRAYDHRRRVAALRGYKFKEDWEPVGVKQTRRVFMVSRHLAQSFAKPARMFNPNYKNGHKLKKIRAEHLSERAALRET